MRIVFTFLLFTFISHSTLAIVDMRNANYSDTWTDLIVPGSGYDLRIKRSYSSRTLFNGVTGFGWCLDIESTLNITADGNLKLTECGGGLEITFRPKSFNYKDTKNVIEQIIAGVKKKNKSLKESYYKKLRADLSYDNNLREEFARQLGIKGSISHKKLFYADGREDENIRIKGNFYIRSLPSGTHERYDMQGILKYIYDKNGNYLKVDYKNKKPISIVDNGGRKLTFIYSKGSEKITAIRGPSKLSVSYKYKGENLISVTNAWKNTYLYTYDELHNLTRIDFPDKTKKLLSYNKDKDWVTRFVDRRGCVETYKYETDKKDPLNHYTSHVEKKCKGKITNASSYEFLYKKKKDGSRYLARTKSDNNGDVTDISYHERFGKPLSVFKDGVKVVFQYYDSGLLKKRSDVTRTTKFFHKNSCKKISRTITDYYQVVRSPSGKKKPPQSLKRRLVRTIKTNFKYNKSKCNLVFANNSIGQTVQLTYDQRGRIKTIEDQSKKLVKISYEERFGKPKLVTRPGLGSIRVSYKADGSINKVNSKDGPTVAVQVASIFNNLLEIISPTAGELSI